MPRVQTDRFIEAISLVNANIKLRSKDHNNDVWLKDNSFDQLVKCSLTP